MGLVDRYSELVGDSREQINELNEDLESLNIDIGMLSKENEKYMQLIGAGSKKTWKAYEELLGAERVTNRKFVSMVAEQSKRKLKKAGRNHTYVDYLSNNTSFATGEGLDVFFPNILCWVHSFRY